jgi:lipoate-protein ligase B
MVKGMAQTLIVQRTGRLPYREAWALQQAYVRDRIADRRPDTVIVTEHDSVFTAGRRYAAKEAVPDSIAGMAVVAVERGGSLTYHGPGQLVLYPILRLQSYCSGPRTFVHALEEVVIVTLRAFGIAGDREPGYPGVWVNSGGRRKIASLGLRIIDGVTMHGVALNVDMDLRPFTHIVPCGIPLCRMIDMAGVLERSVPLVAVEDAVVSALEDVFKVPLTSQSAQPLAMGDLQ